jgi:hypothetical protein
MKRILNNIINIESALHYFDADGKEIAKGNLTGDVSGLTGNVSGRLTGNVSGRLTGDVSGRLTGDVSGLTGNVSGLTGNVSGRLTGDVSGLTGDVSGLTGNVSGLTGNVDECEITSTERKSGIFVSDLVSK